MPWSSASGATSPSTVRASSEYSTCSAISGVQPFSSAVVWACAVTQPGCWRSRCSGSCRRGPGRRACAGFPRSACCGPSCAASTGRGGRSAAGAGSRSSWAMIDRAAGAAAVGVAGEEVGEELRRQHHVVAAAGARGEPVAEDLLGVAVGVEVGGVDEVPAEVEVGRRGSSPTPRRCSRRRRGPRRRSSRPRANGLTRSPDRPSVT